MRRILSYLSAYKLAVVIAFSLMLLELAVELTSPIFMARIIDQGILENNSEQIFFWGGIMVAVSIIAFIGGIINSFYAARASQSVGYDIRQALFAKVLAFSFNNLNKFPTSSLITRLTNDVMQIQMSIFMGLRIASRAPLLLVGSALMAFIVNWRLSLILIFTIPLLVFFMIWIMRVGTTLFKVVQERLDRVNNVLRENLTGIRLIKAFLRHDYEKKRFNTANKSLKDMTIHSLRIMELGGPIIIFVMNSSILVILWFGNQQITNQMINVGEVVAIINYATRMMQAISMLSFILLGYARAQASVNRIGAVLDEEIDLADGQKQLRQATQTVAHITFKEVSFHYKEQQVKALNEISFNAYSGETIALIGATGSGKSTLFQLIPRLYDPTGGQILYYNQPIHTLALEQLRNKIGYVPQESRLFSGTVRENILWGKKQATLEEVIEAAKGAQIHETIMRLPNQYETILGQRGVNLSGGQKQRLSIARALIRKPEILLLDDSTSALDMKTEARILRAIKQLSCTTFIITQKMSTLMVTDQIILLENGQLVAQGDHESLLTEDSLYQKIYQSQYGTEVKRNG
ncbi:ATP-binding cassette, subfamily B [Amphibacillus marinus]|uniref:ATP-binding cassette, subfamily B n=1 Tax=Amphibacillus marinus TaxID=872970 RepID=A0A1H8NCB3_9BACI|nr:ABC transporter ATP-binding protein [Amphibacillus marinus]SEO27202.1 ATP-binding cassette, subfamily B [Amphibacillus marinus]